MFNIFRLLLITAIFMAAPQLRSEVVTADFNNGLPDGWKMVGNLYNDSDRARSGKGIYTSSKQDKANYILTTEIEGDIAFYGRSYNTRGYGYITFYTVNDDETLGDKIKEFRTDNVSSGKVNFQKFTYTLDVPRRIGINLYWSCIDDFTYTPVLTVAEPQLSVNDFASGSSYDFGGSPVSAGTTHTFTLVNKGGSTLSISEINVTGGFSITQGADIAAIESKASAEVTVATPANDATGVLTIVSNDPSSPYTINLSSIYRAPAPIMEIDTDAVDFGMVTAVTSREIKISNSGDAPLSATLTTDSDLFAVSPSQISVSPGESTLVTVTYNYNPEVFGNHSGMLSITPNVGDKVQIPLSAKVRNPNGWFEDFSGNALPDGWEAGNSWSFDTGVAKAAYSYSDRDSRLITPSLKVSEGDEMTFEYKATASFVDIKIMVSRNGGDFTTLSTISLNSKMPEFETYTISGLQPGSYRFCFINDDYELDNFDGFCLDMNAPKMEVTPLKDAAFGKVTGKPEPITYTVANNGTGKMTVNISSDNEYFTVTPSTLTDIEKGSPATFTVNFEYDIENPGEQNATITVTPDYNADAAVKFSASAIAKNPNIWEEDFEEGAIPSDWENEGLWSVSTPYGTGSNGSRMATIRSSQPKYLVTPRLKASKGDKLSFYIGMQYDDEPLKIEYSSDKESWQAINPAADSYIQSADIVFEAPADGFYYLRFTGTYAMLDNFIGFRNAPKTHDIRLDSYDIPTRGHQFAPYTASVTLTETYGNPEQVTARMLVNDEEVVSADTETILPNESATITLTYTPTEAVEDAEVRIIVEYADESLTAEVSGYSVAAAPVFDENEIPVIEKGELPAVVIRYNAEDGWNTITMPFALTEETLQTIFGEKYEIFELSSFENGMLEFKVPELYVAGRPYLVYAYSAPAHDDIILNDVNIEAEEQSEVKCDGVSFKGYYEPSMPENMDNAFIIDSDYKTPKLSAASSDYFKKGFRGYLHIDNPDFVTALKLGNNIVTAVSELIENEIDNILETTVYDLNGIKVLAPAKKGIYIVNGKKRILN